MDVKPRLPIEELKRLERHEKNADRARRLRIVILAIEGWTAPAIGMAVGLSRRICQRWVYRYNDLGWEGLDDRRGRKPQSPLTPEQEAAIHLRIESGPNDKDEVCSLRGKDFQRILADEFGLLRSLSAVYHFAAPTRILVSASPTSPSQGGPGSDRSVSTTVAREAQGHRGRTSGKTAARLLPRRVAFRPAGNHDKRVGQERFTSLGPSADRVRVSVGARCGLPRDGACRGTAQSSIEYQNHQYLPSAIFPNDPC